MAPKLPLPRGWKRRVRSSPCEAAPPNASYRATNGLAYSPSYLKETFTFAR